MYAVAVQRMISAENSSVNNPRLLMIIFSSKLGSTDVIVSSAQGTNDPITSAIHIVLGMYIASTLDIGECAATYRPYRNALKTFMYISIIIIIIMRVLI
jgi:hypothetical protein